MRPRGNHLGRGLVYGMQGPLSMCGFGYVMTGRRILNGMRRPVAVLPVKGAGN
jgi:hypothetical protein